jgi:hypothetical protein
MKIKFILFLAIISAYWNSSLLAKEVDSPNELQHLITTNKRTIIKIARQVRKSISILEDSQIYTDSELFYSSWCVEISTGVFNFLRNEGYSPKLSYSQSGHVFVVLRDKKGEILVIDPTYRQFYVSNIAETFPQQEKQQQVLELMPEVMITKSQNLYKKLISFSFSPFHDFSFNELYSLNPTEEEVINFINILSLFQVDKKSFIYPQNIDF